MFCSLEMPHWWLLLLWGELETEWIPDSLCTTLESKYIHYKESEKVRGSYLSVFPDRSGTFTKSISINMRQSRTEPQALTRPVTIWAMQAQGSLSLEADWGQKPDAEGLPAEGAMWQTSAGIFILAPDKVVPATWRLIWVQPSFVFRKSDSYMSPVPCLKLLKTNNQFSGKLEVVPRGQFGVSRANRIQSEFQRQWSLWASIRCEDPFENLLQTEKI